MIIYVNGCSHSKHQEDGNSFGFYLAKSFSIQNFTTFDIFPWIQPKDFEKKIKEIISNNSEFLLNNANDGKGNDAIYFESISVIQKLIDENKKPDLVCIQWSGPSRRMAMSIQNEHSLDTKNETKYGEMYITHCNPNDHSELLPHFEPLGSYHSLFFIYSMQEFLKKHNIKYTFHCYMELDTNIERQYIFKKVDNTKFVTFDDDVPFYSGWLTKMKENPTAVIDELGHPSTTGKKYITHRILKKLHDLYDVNYSDYNKTKKQFFNFL